MKVSVGWSERSELQHQIDISTSCWTSLCPVQPTILITPRMFIAKLGPLHD
jgi:hypothetical protein